MRRRITTGCITAAAIAALIACTGDAPRPDTSATTRALLAQPRGENLATEVGASALGAGEPALGVDMLGVNQGSMDAPVKVIEFVDYGCGFCRQFQLETFPTLYEEFIATGMVEWKFMPFVAGMFENSMEVSLAAECALDEHPRLFGAFSNLLWTRQSEWKSSDDPAALAREWVVALGGNGVAYDACREQGTRDERVRSATAFAAQLGVRSTPTIWIVGVGPIQGALPVDAFRQVFTDVHAQLTQDAVGPEVTN